jgi:hypothetical protein
VRNEDSLAMSTVRRSSRLQQQLSQKTNIQSQIVDDDVHNDEEEIEDGSTDQDQEEENLEPSVDGFKRPDRYEGYGPRPKDKE